MNTDFDDDPITAALARTSRLDGAQEAFAWHASHHRDDSPPSMPLRGFGARGEYTLWLPNAEATQRIDIVDGEPRVVLLPNVMTTDEMAKLRIDTLLSLRSPDGELRFHINLAAYAVRIIKMCYTVTDADLSMLLAGDTWHQSVVRHLIGGDSQIDRLVRTDASTAMAPKVVFVPVPAHRKSWLSRLLNRA